MRGKGAHRTPYVRYRFGCGQRTQSLRAHLKKSARTNTQNSCTTTSASFRSIRSEGRRRRTDRFLHYTPVRFRWCVGALRIGRRAADLAIIHCWLSVIARATHRRRRLRRSHLPSRKMLSEGAQQAKKSGAPPAHIQQQTISAWTPSRC